MEEGKIKLACSTMEQKVREFGGLYGDSELMHRRLCGPEGDYNPNSQDKSSLVKDIERFVSQTVKEVKDILPIEEWTSHDEDAITVAYDTLSEMAYEAINYVHYF